jgi:hypothetical protein
MDMTSKTPPMLTDNYPAPGTRLGQGWAALWAELAKASRRVDPYLDGRELAEELAPAHDLNPSTLVALLSRMAKGGILEREGRPVQTGRGSRNRTHYRIPAKADALAA